MTAAGVVAASVGFTVYGLATSFYETPGNQEMLGMILMIVGVVVAAAGIVMSKQIPEED